LDGLCGYDLEGFKYLETNRGSEDTWSIFLRHATFFNDSEGLIFEEMSLSIASIGMDSGTCQRQKF